MDKILELSLKEYNEITSQKILGEGQCGIVYEYQDDKIIKLWHQKVMELEVLISQFNFDFTDFYYKIKAILDCNIISTNFIFPETLVYYKDQFSGYIRKKINGQDFTKEQFLHFDLERFYQELEIIEQEIIKLSLEHQIVIHDVKFANMMISQNKKHLYITDTDLYFIMPDEDKEKIKQRNIKVFNNLFYKALNNTKIITQESRIREILVKALTENLSFAQFIYAILENKDDNIHTFEDIKTYSLR